MTQNQNSNQQSRRERIMNSDKQLPGDKERARDEEIEDFDAPDSVVAGTGGRAHGDPNRREEINANEGQLPGDFDREADDKRVDQSIHANKKKD